MSVSGGSGTSSLVRLPALRINRNSPSPGQWTLVREYNIEKKDQYNEWSSNVSSQLLRLRQQLISYMTASKALDEEIEEETIKLMTLKELAIPPSPRAPTPKQLDCKGVSGST
ncbi:PREDICTED: uncharacterized protein LOC100634264 [Amphimedon queenslandica]|uniref:Uncharacterized protein n=1 Tax=Amphimedon queenslandica TaxID=400682 RepID=A0A1X7VDY4_AMPQE|nr:PREDICTED: uncharacterized protein LOC100634264 [Amphimedon queenslandica]|eukprot:XP_003384509.1 PREDICTED: uncharacterized protein LOC100634264 [Amphimedon queenslandica]